MFVDDTIIAEFGYLICQASNNSVLTTSVFNGNINIVKEPISIKGFELFVTRLNVTMGLITNSSSIPASYKHYKRSSTLDLQKSPEWEPK